MAGRAAPSFASPKKEEPSGYICEGRGWGGGGVRGGGWLVAKRGGQGPRSGDCRPPRGLSTEWAQETWP